MNMNQTTHSILQRVPAILAVTAASYGLDPVAAQQGRGARTSASRPQRERDSVGVCRHSEPARPGPSRAPVSH